MGLADYPPLTPAQYAVTFDKLKRNCSELDMLIERARPVIGRFAGRPINLLSVGAGAGETEHRFITELGLVIKYYHAVEPNQKHADQLSSTISQWGEGLRHQIDVCTFEEVVFPPEMQFDLVLMSHMLYYVEDIQTSLQKARRLTLPDVGLVMAIIQSHGASRLLREPLLRGVSAGGRDAHDRTAADVCAALVQADVSFRCTPLPATIDVTDFVSGVDLDVVTFMLQTDFKKLPKTLQTDIRRTLLEHSDIDKNGRTLFRATSSLITY